MTGKLLESKIDKFFVEIFAAFDETLVIGMVAPLSKWSYLEQLLESASLLGHLNNVTRSDDGRFGKKEYAVITFSVDPIRANLDLFGLLGPRNERLASFCIGEKLANALREADLYLGNWEEDDPLLRVTVAKDLQQLYYIFETSYGIPVEGLISCRIKHIFSRARGLVSFVLKNRYEKKLNTVKLAKIFGLENHASILSYFKKFNKGGLDSDKYKGNIYIAFIDALSRFEHKNKMEKVAHAPSDSDMITAMEGASAHLSELGQLLTNTAYIGSLCYVKPAVIADEKNRVLTFNINPTDNSPNLLHLLEKEYKRHIRFCLGENLAKALWNADLYLGDWRGGSNLLRLKVAQDLQQIYSIFETTYKIPAADVISGKGGKKIKGVTGVASFVLGKRYHGDLSSVIIGEILKKNHTTILCSWDDFRLDGISPNCYTGDMKTAVQDALPRYKRMDRFSN